MNEVVLTLSRSIKEQKWVQITYRNLSNEITKYWIAIKDVLPEKRLLVDAIKLGEIENLPITLNIYFSGIIEAALLDSTYYPSSADLIEKIENQPLSYEWLYFFNTDHKLLEYYKECYKEDSDLEERNFSLVRGFDSFQLENSLFKIKTAEQFGEIMKILKRQAFNSEEDRPIFQRLSFNVLSIRVGQSIRPVLYKDVRLDLNQKCLVLGKKVRINSTFKTDDSLMVLKHYIGMEPEAFVKAFQQNEKEAFHILESSLHGMEKVDTSPYLAVFKKQTFVTIEKEYQQIADAFLTNTLSKPLSAFFGKLGKINRRTKRDYPIFLTQKVNFDQLRGIFNAINQDITYVQGPPGTGKTTMIKEAAISSLFNERTMLIVSNNNEAIDNVDRLLNSFRHSAKEIPFVSLRIGNIDKTQETLEKMRRTYESVLRNKDKPNENKLREIKQKIIKSFIITNDLVESYEHQIILKQKLEDLEKIEELSEKKLLPEQIKNEIADIKNRIKQFKNITEDQLVEGVKIDEHLLFQFLYYSSLKRLNNLAKDDYKELREIILSKDSSKVDLFNEYIRNNDNLKKLLDIFPIVVTTNLSASRLGDAAPHFDLMIMDEAGQCQVANSLLPMARADRALFVGDHRQLQPVIVLDAAKNEELRKSYGIAEEYDYVNNSILKLMRTVDTKSLNILLRKHYRCHHTIINFSNQKYYGGKLIIPKPDRLSDAVQVIKIDNGDDNQRNVARKEIAALLKEIRKKDFPPESIGVITPFRNQANEIALALAQEGLSKIKVGTVHTFQGGEKEHIFFSTSLTKNTNLRAGEWAVNSEELVNVAVTRAKKKLTLICDPEIIKFLSKDEKSDLYDLYQYIKEKGTVRVPENADILENFIKADDTYSEREFYETLSHFITTQQNLTIKKREPIINVIKEIDPKKPYFKFANQAHFDFVLYLDGTRYMAFEINGNEHDSIDGQKAKDTYKKMICDDYKFKLNKLPNFQTRRYDLVVDMIGQEYKN